MLTKERKFQKTLDLYTQVIESGSTWGMTTYEDVLQNKRIISLTDAQGTGPNDKYIQRQNVSTSTKNNDYHFSKSQLKIGQMKITDNNLDDSYKHVRNGSRPKNEIKLTLKKVEEWYDYN